MQILNDVSLKDYSTMRLGGKAKFLIIVNDKKDLVQTVEWAQENNTPIIVIGGGSNVIFKDDFDGLVIINRISGFEVTTFDNSAMVKVGAGENWDSVVKQTVELGLSGLEMLSLIPGTAGATPVQNVGAYGAETADNLESVEVYDLQNHNFITLSKKECGFSYRNSIFKDVNNRKYIISEVTFKLSKETPKPPFYASLQRYLDQNGINQYSPQIIRDAVIAIRQDKLPDPAKIANSGSFFKNPIIPADQFKTLVAKFPDIPNWPTPDGQVKIAAGWLLDKAGIKEYSAHGMKTYENNALVFVNQSAKNFADLDAFKKEVVKKVHDKFGVTLKQEPELF
ncbi:MAG: UDP-N-acetylmuramate dehydrogenase [Candidatus Woesebacteria bacterium]|jgi:UDP-N-acetylmuramate dehydrogenase